MLFPLASLTARSHHVNRDRSPESMSAVWAKELEGSAITVNVLVPGGPTDTPMISDQSGWPREKCCGQKSWDRRSLG
jgi:NAD(P)-dependent dehydrogenase (short-subunit alcohol dehydrogenase family)